MANSRRYFRYDVVIPMHFKMIEAEGKQAELASRSLITKEEESQSKLIDKQLKTLFDKVFSASSNTLYEFYVLEHRINFMGWLIECLMKSEDPRNRQDYLFRLKEDRKLSLPVNKTSSAISALVSALYKQVDVYLHELHQVIENSVDGKIFKYGGAVPGLFDDKRYVSNLDQLAEEDVLPAKILRLLVDKLNLLIGVYSRLNAAYRSMINSHKWMNYKVNLGAGGLSFLAAEPYEQFSCLDVFMDLDGEIILCRGKIISQTDSHDELFPYRVGVQFDLLTTEQERAITLYEQRKELKDAMLAVTLA